MVDVPLTCLLFAVIWNITIMFLYIPVRVTLVAMRKASPRVFVHGSNPDLGNAKVSESYKEMYARTIRAHLNMLENLPVYAILILISKAIAFESVAFDNYCIYWMWARVLHSLIHISSKKANIVRIRALLFGAQLVIYVFMILELSHADAIDLTVLLPK